MSISSSNLYKYPDLICKSVNGYSFTKELVNTVNNFNFKRSAYNTLSGTNDTEMSYIWTALSNIAENACEYSNEAIDENDKFTTTVPPLMYSNISEVFEEHILNYIDNISNIDICKIKSLQSMIQQLGINYTLFDKLQLMPLQIQNLLDVLSIKKEYLVNSDKIKALFAQLLYNEVSSYENVSSDLSNIALSLTEHRLTAEITSTNETYPLSSIDNNISINTSAYIDNYKLYNFTSAVYKNVLSTFCALPYNNLPYNKIYADMSANILLSDFSIYNTNADEVEELNIYRLQYNIPKSFNESIEADNIENGISSFSDYSIHEQYLLSAEYAYRYQPLSAAALYSRYYYYRQRLVRDFFKFVENEYADYLSLYLNTNQYNIDNSYLVVSNDIKVSLLYENENTPELNENMIDYVAVILTNITEAIRDIREQVKTQVQKNFLKGTKQHIAYIIREYIRNNIYPTYQTLITDLYKKAEANAELTGQLSDYYHEYETSDVIININEYKDPTEYFNISTAIDAISDNVNLRYWEGNASIHAIAPFNSNNIFIKPNIINSASRQNFTQKDISNLYLQNLQVQFETDTISSNTYIKEQNKKLNDFLNLVYNSGADDTYLDVSNNICCNLDFVDQNELTTVKTIADLPQIEYQTILDNLAILSGNLDSRLNLQDIIEQYAVSVDGLSNITIGAYNDLMSNVKEILVQNNKTLDDLNIKNVDITVSDKDIEWRKYKEKLFKKYSGTNTGMYSFYNIKNMRHPTYQIHPYVKNFTDSDIFDYPIDNIANITSEKITKLLINNISAYVDADGYLQNIWNNQLNTNSDYLSEYEKSDNKTQLGIVSEQIDYDGLFYPEAINDFINRESDFINDLISEPCKNKWYKDLGLSKYELSAIANQLKDLNIIQLLKMQCNNVYDIYRYGKDLYGNMYILVKEYNDINSITDDFSNIDDDTKLNTPGVVWMRKKNHPIAFPMMLYRNNTYDQEYSQIKLTENDKQMQSNIAFDNFTKQSLYGNLSAPEIYDFYISKDRTELFFLGCNTANATIPNYVIHANIKKKYFKNPPNQMYKYYLTLDNFNNNIKGIDTTAGIQIDNGYKFNSFYNFDAYIGIVETSACVDKNAHVLCCNIKMPYWNKNSLDGNQIQERLNTCLVCDNCADDADEDYKIDITNTKRLTIAYQNNILSSNNDISLHDYLGKSIDYNNPTEDLSDLHIFANSVSTREWKFDAKQFVSLTAQARDYLPYNDLGFIPVYAATNSNYVATSDSTNTQLYVNDISSRNNNNNNSGWYYDIKVKNQIKVNLVGLPHTKDKGIFFKRILPVRVHEDFRLSNIDSILPSKLPSKYTEIVKAVDYFSARYSEELSNRQYINDASNSIYDPLEFEKTINYYNLSVRIDESYFNTFNDLDLLKYHNNDFPKDGSLIDHIKKFKDSYYFWRCKKELSYEYFSELYEPGHNNTIKVKYDSNNKDVYIIKLSPAYQPDGNIDEISVTWIKAEDNIYGGKVGIKLDFNAQYYNSDPEKIYAYNNSNSHLLYKNFFNWKHSFLNLDKPGDAGYLQIWHDSSNGEKCFPGNTYYIKNISDDKPKFILSLVDDIRAVNDNEGVDYKEYYLMANKFNNETNTQYNTYLSCTNADGLQYTLTLKVYND